MNSDNKDMGPPWLTSYLLYIANGLMLAHILVVFVLDFGLIPVDLSQINSWLPKIFLTFYWITILTIMIWFYRMTRYLQERSGREFENGPLMAAFGFIIPILSLWKPYESMLQIFKASRNPDDWKDTKQASIVGWWWASWILASIAGIAARVANLDGETAFSKGQVYLVMVVRAIIVIKSILLLLIVSQVLRWLKKSNTFSAAEQVF